MGALNIERTILGSLNSSIGSNGIREDDEIVLDLFQEKQRRIKLKQVKYKISTSYKFSENFLKAEIQLPVFGEGYAEFEIILVNDFISRSNNEKSRYLMRSVTNNPFKLNGNYCYEAFLERGDVVTIGLNRLYFSKPVELLGMDEKNAINENVLNEEIIKSSLSIMIEGETGTGKTTLAKKIHDESYRNGRFVHLNLSSFSPGLIESELFGHIKGAFTGAIHEKRGAILEANRGTLFLDEIDSLSLDLQTKLLLFLDNFQFRAVGGNSTQNADVRLIFASGTSLKNLVEQHKMRRDFYYRLNSGVLIYLSSLRENPIKIKTFCNEYERKHFVVICPNLVTHYEQCKWPGNYRQLASHLNKKKVLSRGKKIVLDSTDSDLINDSLDSNFLLSNQLLSLEEIKNAYCVNVFLKSEKKYIKASKVLKISQNTLKKIINDRQSFNQEAIK